MTAQRGEPGMARHLSAYLLCALAFVLAGCGSFQVEAGFKTPAELTATAEAQAAGRSPNPQPGRLAFVRGGDIWVQDLPDGKDVRLTQDGRNDTPLWSPSGEWLAFRKDQQQFWVIRRSGTDARSVDLVSTALAKGVDWSPVADRLAFVSRGALVTMNADGTDRRELIPPTPDPKGSGVTAISWSPDGQWIAFEKLEWSAQGVPGTQGLWRIKADGSETNEVHVDRYPGQTQSYLAGWSPDGQFLYFWRGMQMSPSLLADGTSLMRVPITGGEPLEVARAMLPHPDLLSWSPDGRVLAVTDGGGRATWDNKTIAIATGEATPRRLSDSGQADLYPAWSPDGRWIAFTSGPSTRAGGGEDAKWAMAQRRTWLTLADGSAKRALTSDPGFRDERPRWSADGTFVLVARLQGEQAQLWLMRSDGSEQWRVVEELTPHPGWFGYYGYLEWARLYDWWTGASAAREATNATKPASVMPTPIATPAAPEAGLSAEARRVARLASSPIELSDGRLWSLDWSPKAQVIAYGAQDGFYVARAPGFQPMRIAPQSGNTPLWSPNATSVAFTGVRGKGDQAAVTVWLATADGSSVRDLLPGDRAGLRAKSLVTWVDEGTVAFTERCGTACNRLATINVHRGDVKPLTALSQSVFPKVIAARYDWSPNRRLVAAEDWSLGLPTTHLLDMVGEFAAPLVDSVGGKVNSFQQFLGWAPDSQSILYTQWPASERPWPVMEQAPDLYLWDTKKRQGNGVEIGKAIGQLLVPHAYQASWSPDGKRIAFLLLGRYITDERGRITATDFQPGRPFDLYLGIQDMADYKPLALIRVASALTFDDPNDAIRWFEIHAPKWAPDGTALAYWDEGENLWISSADGGVARQVTRNVIVQSAAWSPDGKVLALQLASEIWIVANPLAN